jgi:branched-chain amino acid transport system ATP-binding protein
VVLLGLAPNLVDEIFVFLGALKEAGVALVVVEQFVHRALALADDVVVIARGSIRLAGASGSLDEDQIFAAYAGTHSPAVQGGVHV